MGVAMAGVLLVGGLCVAPLCKQGREVVGFDSLANLATWP
jgi:hypothetical protein